MFDSFSFIYHLLHIYLLYIPRPSIYRCIYVFLSVSSGYIYLYIYSSSFFSWLASKLSIIWCFFLTTSSIISFVRWSSPLHHHQQNVSMMTKDMEKWPLILWYLLLQLFRSPSFSFWCCKWRICCDGQQLLLLLLLLLKVIVDWSSSKSFVSRHFFGLLFGHQKILKSLNGKIKFIYWQWIEIWKCIDNNHICVHVASICLIWFR